MHHLLYYPLASYTSLIFLREYLSDETLNSIPFFRLVEEFTRIVEREGFIKFTPKGALPRKILHELYGFGFLKEEFITVGFYADKYTTAFPTFWDRFQDGMFGTARNQCTSCYALRAFERFLKWFGLVQFKDDDDFLHREKSLTKRTDVLENVLALK